MQAISPVAVWSLLFLTAHPALVSGQPTVVRDTLAPSSAVTIPAVPTLPRTLAFADEAAGRRLFFALRDAAQNAPALAYTVRMVRTTTSTPSIATIPDFITTEQVKARPVHRQISVVTDNTTGNERMRIVRRLVANGESITATHFESRLPATAATSPVREFSRLPLEEGVPLGRSAQAVGAVPIAAQTLLLLGWQDLGRGNVLWRDASASRNGSDVLVAIEQPAGRPGQTGRVRRFTINSAHHLTRFEEWITTQREPQPARGNRPADPGIRVAYRQEEYSDERVPAGGFAAATWAQTVPANYVEKPVPSERVPQATPPPPDGSDTRAVALLKRWQNAQERFLSYSAQIEQTVQMTPRTATSRPTPPQWADAAATYTVETRRAGKARVAGQWVRGGDTQRAPRSFLYISDGTRLRAVNRDTGEAQIQNMDGPEQLWGRLTRAGLANWGSAWGWVFTAAPVASNFDKVSYEGKGSEDGEPVEILRLENTSSRTGRRGISVENEAVLHVYLAADGLPRRIDTQSVTEYNSGVTFDRDQPPLTRTVTRYRNVRVDREPSVGAFDIPNDAPR